MGASSRPRVSSAGVDLASPNRTVGASVWLSADGHGFREPSRREGILTMSPQRLLQIALALFGAVFLLVYPLAIVWPSGWAWHAGAPHDSQYFMMIVGVYATLGVPADRVERSTSPSQLDLVHRVVERRARRHHGGAVDAGRASRAPARGRARAIPRGDRAWRVAGVVGRGARQSGVADAMKRPLHRGHRPLTVFDPV